MFQILLFENVDKFIVEYICIWYCKYVMSISCTRILQPNGHLLLDLHFHEKKKRKHPEISGKIQIDTNINKDFADLISQTNTLK